MDLDLVVNLLALLTRTIITVMYSPTHLPALATWIPTQFSEHTCVPTSRYPAFPTVLIVTLSHEAMTQ